jgi:hypothetical protein
VIQGTVLNELEDLRAPKTHTHREICGIRWKGKLIIMIIIIFIYCKWQ